MKTAIKEFFIICLLCVAIVLVLGILFYEYTPTGLCFPEEVKHVRNTEIAGQIEEIETSTNNASIIKSYKMDQADLDMYASQNIYKSGKSDPFADYKDEEESTSSSSTANSSDAYSSKNSNSSSKTTTTTNDKKSDSSNSSSNNNTSSSSSSKSNEGSSTGTLYEKPGVK